MLVNWHYKNCDQFIEGIYSSKVVRQMGGLVFRAKY